MSPQSSDHLRMGPRTHKVPLKLFQLNRKRLVERLLTKIPSNLDKAVVLMQGGDEVPFYDTDITYNIFRQESFFMWTFGVTEPGFYGIIEVGSGISHLFMPRLPETYAVWMGPIHGCEHFKNKYKVDHVHYVDEIQGVLKGLTSSLLILNGTNSDSGLSFKQPTFEGIEGFKVDNTILYNEISDLRVYKTDLEVQVMKYVTEVSSTAHRKVMRLAAPGKTEYQCESEFLNHCYGEGGCRFVSYTCICASHTNSAILHYGHAGAPNDRTLKNGEMVLFDMGANYFGYAADITCSFPVNGKFTADQKIIYEAVLNANLAVHQAAKPGVLWSDMHKLANRVCLEALKKAGLVRGDVDEMVASGLGGVFQPHGLGHLIGLDVHDVGGYLPKDPPRLSKPQGLEKLRTNRVLQAGMAVTIEPGCYFVDFVLDRTLGDPVLGKFLVPEVIERFRNFGGVRIEDDVVITENGVLNLTKVPRTVKEIEDWMAGLDDGKYD